MGHSTRAVVPVLMKPLLPNYHKLHSYPRLRLTKGNILLSESDSERLRNWMTNNVTDGGLNGRMHGIGNVIFEDSFVSKRQTFAGDVASFNVLRTERYFSNDNEWVINRYSNDPTSPALLALLHAAGKFNPFFPVNDECINLSRWKDVPRKSRCFCSKVASDVLYASIVWLHHAY